MNNSTRICLRFVDEMLAFMIGNDIRHYRLPKCDLPAQLVQFPPEIAKYDKILKVLDDYSEFDIEVEGRNAFHVFDEQDEITYRVLFAIAEDGTIHVRVDPVDGPDAVADA